MIGSLLTEMGMDYYVKGDEAFAPCPYHHDSGDSWSVNLDTGLHHCFTCGFSGNLATLVSHVLGLSYQEAVIFSGEKTGMSKARQWLKPKGSQPHEELRLTNADLALFVPPPASMLEGRKITARSASEYEVLWNPWKSSWIFPIRKPSSWELLGWQEKHDRRFRNYPVSCRKSEALFGLRAFERGGTAILVESPVDAVRCRSSGAGSGLSGYGVRVSDRQLDIIHDVAGHLLLALDNDHAGMAETGRICREFRQLPVSVFNYGSSSAKDIGDMTDEEIRWGVDHAVSGIYYR